MKNANTTEPATIANPNLNITNLMMPISYSLAAVIVLSGLGAFLRQLFNLGKE
ncbi:hypothetical protein [Pseudanabaena sp. SR411]|uniref:hypothetical protein n=1 Tax=Pseudanabaena sp. SR411 TaxID=1980935 RepID=UPI00159521A4|nr:hypothetical protein [Pseudanabaena sp. SR411]